MHACRNTVEDADEEGWSFLESRTEAKHKKSSKAKRVAMPHDAGA